MSASVGNTSEGVGASAADELRLIEHTPFQKTVRK